MLGLMSSTLATLERADVTQIRRFQERRLRALIRTAAGGAKYYRDWFRSADISPRDIRTLDDLKQLPLLDRRDLVDHFDDFRVYPQRLMWSARSNGTSSSYVTVYRTPGSSIYELAVLRRQWSWFGLPDDARRVVLRGSTFAAQPGAEPTAELRGAHQLLVSSYHLTPDNLQRIATRIRSFRPHAIEGWPSSITLLAALLQEAGERLPVAAVITSSEVISRAQRTLMREVFGGRIIDHYGQTERVTMLGGCEADGYHVFPDYGIVELLPIPGVADRWEIVGTPLHNWGFPLFRYRTGDEVGPAAASSCRCGRAFPVVGAVDGRIEDTFTAADGRSLPMPSALLDDLTGVRDSQVAQLAPGHFEFRLVPGTAFDAKLATRQAQQSVARLFGRGHVVTVRTVSELTRPAGGKLKPAIVEDR